MKWLVTSFEPFAGADTNSSQIVLRKLAGLDSRLVFEPGVPVEFGRGWEFLRARIPADIDGVLALGQAESRSRIGLERVALNCIDARIADNAGSKPALGKIDEQGPDVYWSAIPWERYAHSPHCERSYSAGTFVCNELMFHLNAWAASQSKLAGFVHIPALKSQTHPTFSQAPKMDDDLAVRELASVLAFLVAL